MGNQLSYTNEFRFIQCKLGTNYVARATPSSPANASNGVTWIIDCSSGDIHGLFGYYDGQGRLHRTPAFTSHLGQPAILEDRHYVRKRTRATVLHSMGILVHTG